MKIINTACRTPVVCMWVPSTPSPPCGFESTIAGSAELYADAIRFIPARKNMSVRTVGLPLSHLSPSFTEESRGSFLSVLSGSFMGMNSSSTIWR